MSYENTLTPQAMSPAELSVTDATLQLPIAQGAEVPILPNQPPLSVESSSGQTLAGAVAVGGRIVGLVHVGNERRVGVVDIRQTFPVYDINRRALNPRFLGWLEEGQPTAIGVQSRDESVHGFEATLIGGQLTIANPQGGKMELLVSNGPTYRNGPFDNMPWAIPQRFIPGATAPAGTEAKTAAWQRPEFDINGIHYTIEGRDPDLYRGVVVSTTDPKGYVHRFMVYNSRSEGGRRITQGRAEETRTNGKVTNAYIKGMASLPGGQYTQDTQLHPKFAAQLDRIFDTGADEEALPPTDVMRVIYSEKQGDALEAYFASQMQVVPLKRELNDVLHQLPAGYLDAEHVTELTGQHDAPRRDQALRSHITSLNAALAKANVVPDFTQQPLTQAFGEHPIFGTYAVETYQKDVEGRTIEWHIARDGAGHIWIERIRDAHSEASTYGTDQTLVYSGLLTSKPCDYPQQTTGLPAEWVKPLPNSHYLDITNFLEQLLPIQQYRAQKAHNPNLARMYYHGPDGRLTYL